MGTINVVIYDALDVKFREEVFKRKGMKKGNLTEALEEAIEAWIKNSIIEQLEGIANDPGQVSSVQEEATKTLAKMGFPAVPSLTRIARKKGNLTSLQKLALKHIDLLIGQRRSV